MDAIRQLLLKKLREGLNSQEQAELDSWLAKDAANQELLAMLENEEKMASWLHKLEQIDESKAWEKIQQKKRELTVVLPLNSKKIQRHSSRNYLWRVAAVLLLCIGGACAYLSWKGTTQKIQPVVVKAPHKPVDIPPGGDKAILTLADGSQITLDSASDGKLANQGNIKIIKLDNGQLAYKGNPVDASGQLLYNTITTPKGGQYQLVLADGTKVWLNAASSFRYPVTFIGTSRKVELTGEGYFEVAKNKTLPFIVQAGGTEVTVLGTHFNVMSYTNEQAQEITLLEGSVRVRKGPQMVVIKPGQQASVKTNINVAEADTEEATAWKNGEFIFKNTDINEIMRQLERWYDIEVQTKDFKNPPRFYGIISRNASLSKVLEMLEITGTVNFSIEGKTLTLR